MREKVFVNEDKRTCVVVLTNREQDVYDVMRKVMRRVPKEMFRFVSDESFVALASGNPSDWGTFRGIAKCHPDDVFTEQEGIDLARERAYRQYRRAMNREFQNIISVLDDIVEGVENEINYSYE